MDLIKNKNILFVGFKDTSLAIYIIALNGVISTTYSDKVNLIIIKNSLQKETLALKKAKLNNKTIVTKSFFIDHYATNFVDYGKFLSSDKKTYKKTLISKIVSDISTKLDTHITKSLYSPSQDTFYVFYKNNVTSFKFDKNIKNIKTSIANGTALEYKKKYSAIIL
jgi:predicted transcriptional regulator